MTAAETFLSSLGRNDIPVAPSVLLACRARLVSTPLARWEIEAQRTALVDCIDYILAKHQENP